jgi:ATP-dependent RNA helicase DHX57
MCQHTRLLFCTFGVLLRQLQCDGALDNITHIVIDEVHERNLDGDILMGLLKQFLVTTPHLRVVLMSATLDADRFAAYWGNNTPRMHIPGRTFPVTDFLLEDVLSITGYIPPKNGKKKKFGYGNQQRPRKASPWGDSERSDDEDKDGEDKEEEKVETAAEAKSQTYSIPLEDLVKRVDETRIDYDLLGQLVRQLVLDKTMGKDGSILVFLPGAPEINQAKTAVGKICGGMPVLLLPLHGGLQPKDQNLVFRPSSSGVKVILSTNVAETSITIPDCTVVIDTCREKQSSYDPSNRMPLLLEQFASRASLKQRRGRAGRVREGKCYKLISQATYSKLNEHSAPEITRCALDQTLLSLLFLGVERGSGTFLRTLLDPPGQEAVDAAIFSLWKLGAVEKQLPSGDLPLTPLGMHLAGIPAPPVVGKSKSSGISINHQTYFVLTYLFQTISIVLVMGSILGCRQGALAMAAGISVGRSPFLRIDDPSFSRRRGGSNGEEESIEEMKNKRILEERAKLFKKAGNSDHAMLAGAYLDWESLGDGGGKRKQYCDTLGLNGNGMRDILKLVNQLGSSLRSAGYVASEESDRNAHSWRILRACVVSSMAPGQLVRVHRPSTKYVDTAEGAQIFHSTTRRPRRQCGSAIQGRAGLYASVFCKFCSWKLQLSLARVSFHGPDLQVLLARRYRMQCVCSASVWWPVGRSSSEWSYRG